MKKIAIIPARSGSKRVKDKNIMDLCGKPLIAHTIEAAIESGEFERVIVSTDSELYADISRKFGAEVFMRKANLAADTTTTYEVLEDIFKNNDFDIDYFALLQVTSPLRTAVHIKEAIALFEKNFDSCDSLISLKETPFPVSWIYEVAEDMTYKKLDINRHEQGGRTVKDCVPNGAIYLAKVKEYLETKRFNGPKSIAYVMNQEDSVDVDTFLDYQIARTILTDRNNK